MRAAEAVSVLSGLPDERHIALAVSGGSDSVAMLRLFAGSRQPGLKLSVLTVDHGLREGSAREAQFVSSLCADLGLVHAVLPWEGAKSVTGIQAKARRARYDLMTSWCRANSATSLLTAHTRDDQAETVAMRQRRTQTALSLSGILEDMQWNDVTVRRPLLHARREALRDYLRSMGQSWIDDPSNDNRAFERVRVRQALAGDAALAEIAAQSAAAARAAVKAANAWLGGNLVTFPEGYGTLARDAFRTLDSSLKQPVLRGLLRQFGGSTATPGELSKLADWLASNEISRRTLGGAVFATRQAEVVLGREWSRIPPATIPESGELIWDRRFRVLGEAGTVLTPAGHISQLARLAHIPRFVQDALPAASMPGPRLVDASFIPRLR